MHDALQIIENIKYIINSKSNSYWRSKSNKFFQINNLIFHNNAMRQYSLMKNKNTLKTNLCKAKELTKLLNT